MALEFLTRVKEEFSLHRKLWDPSNRFETSWCLSPYVLFGLRALFSLYIFISILYILAYQCTHGNSDDTGCRDANNSFSYFTNLTFWGLGFYFLFAAIHTFSYARWGKPTLDRFPRLLQALHSLLYSTVVTYPIIVTAVYWAILFNPSDYPSGWYPRIYDGWTNVTRHAMNAGFALFEIVMPRTDCLPWAHLPWLIMVLALYLALAYVTKATKGFYPYSFLNPEEGDKGSGGVAAYIMGILAAIIVVFLFVRVLIWVRKLVTERKMMMDGKFARQRTWRSDEELAGGMEMRNH